jgi:HD-like signal output (HDOD) protein
MADPQHGFEVSRRIEAHISRMPSLPVTVTRVLDICNNPAASAIELSRVISLDPVLMGQVLRLVNSAFCGLREAVPSLPRAIIMLGMNTVKNLALSSAVLKALGGNRPGSLPMEQFWLHSLCTGVAARWFATLKGVRPDASWDYFVGGLLHDLGKIPLNNVCPAEYGTIISRTAAGQVPLCEAERDTLGLDHAQVGAMIARQWKLGNLLEDCLAHHHTPFLARIENREMVGLVELADMCAKRFEVGSAGGSAPGGEEMEVICLSRGVSEDDLVALGEVLSEEIGNARVFLQLSESGGTA